MAEATGVDPRALEWGAHLATLPAEDRKRLVKAQNQAMIANLPEEEVGALPVRTLGEFLDTEVEIPPMLVEPGLVARGGLTALIAKGGKGKTTLSFNRLLRWSMGKPLFDDLPEVMAPTGELRSLIIENEGAGWHTQNMLNTIIDNNDFTDAEKKQAREHVHVWGDGGWSKMRLDNEANIDSVKRAVDAYDIDILFMEPFRLLWRGEENSSTEMMIVMESFFDIAAEFDCAVMVSHHESKGGVEDGGDAMEKGRGSSVFSDLGAVMERWAPAGQNQREWKLTKWRYADPPAPVRMSYDRQLGGYRHIPEDDNVRALVKLLYSEPGSWFTIEELHDETGESKDKVRRLMTKAMEGSEFNIKRQRDAGGGQMRYRIADADPDEDTGGLPV